MKKIVLVLLCAFCLLAAACGKPDDVADATKVVKGYCKAISKGDIAGCMQYMTKEYRDGFGSVMAEIMSGESSGKLYSMIMKQTRYKIKSVDLTDGKVFATVISTLPDMNDVFCESRRKYWDRYQCQ